MVGWVRRQGSRLGVLEGGVALQRLGERHAALGDELVAVEPAHTVTGRVRRSKCSEGACCVGAKGQWVGGFDGTAADRSSARVVLLLRASASAMPASGPSLLSRRFPPSARPAHATPRTPWRRPAERRPAKGSATRRTAAEGLTAAKRITIEDRANTARYNPRNVEPEPPRTTDGHFVRRAMPVSFQPKSQVIVCNASSMRPFSMHRTKTSSSL